MPVLSQEPSYLGAGKAGVIVLLMGIAGYLEAGIFGHIFQGQIDRGLIRETEGQGVVMLEKLFRKHKRGDINGQVTY